MATEVNPSFPPSAPSFANLLQRLDTPARAPARGRHALRSDRLTVRLPVQTLEWGVSCPLFAKLQLRLSGTSLNIALKV